ncbi:MAG: hypothetical protein HY808_12455 [Nitrospirae bacterium]|nr:hypothetical protein [Nitrospirota bacterium]
MTNELDVLKIVIERLESAGIHYMVSGSIAANFYTIPRMTRDIDIIIEVGENEAAKLFSIFSGDFYIDTASVKDAIHDKHMFNIIHNEGIVKVDFIIKKDTEYRRLEFDRRRTIVFEGLKIDITSPEDLVISKLYWAKDSLSEMQIRDVKNILKTVPDIDINYIKEWIKRLELEDIYKEIKQ